MRLESEILKPTSQLKKLKNLFCAAQSKNYAVAIWSLPNTTCFKLIIDTSHTIEHGGEVEIENVGPGFIVSPFDNSDGKKITFLKGDILFDLISDTLEFSATLSEEKKQWAKEAYAKDEFLKYTFKNPPTESREEIDYVSLVEEGIKEINKGSFEKFVPSRQTTIPLNNNFDPVESLVKLREAYSNAFCYLLSTDELGTWMAATPELLIDIENEKRFLTVALAGTQKMPEDESLSDIAWTQKEIEEQAMVSRYIINCFKKIRLREFDERGPKTARAGNLVHLKTEFSVDMKETSFPLLGSVMLKLLHPTSAVCGMPLEPAFQFLKENEGYDRQLFAGYLGPVNINMGTSIYVNLRCMQIFKDKGILFAGAGVTHDSNPEKEFLETEMKFKTLLNILN